MRVLVLLLSTLLALAALEGDPRPTVLIIGENNSAPFGSAPSWIEIVADDHPEWKILADVDTNRGLATAGEQLDAILAPHARIDLVLVFLGTNDVDAKRWPAGGGADVQTKTAELLSRLAAHAKTAKARRVIATPVPVIDARLDKWSKDRFVEGQARSDAVAAAVRAAATAAGTAVIDVHAWAKADVEKDVPGRIVGSIGWLVRDWGHPILARFLDAELAKVMPAPPDAAAFAAWQAEQAAFAKLDAALAATGDGIVRHGAALKATVVKDLTTAEVPLAALAGETLDLLFKAEADKGAAVVLGTEKPRPLLTVVTAQGEVKIEAPATAWQVIDEAAPKEPVDPNRFRLNQGKMRYYGMARDGAGVRRYVLLRFPLAALAGRTPTAATVAVAARNVLDNADAALGAFTIHLIEGRDRRWHPARATWASRDGVTPWTGAAKDATARKAAVDAALAGAPAAVVKAAAE